MDFWKLFSADFLPHGYCMRWQSDVIWLHIVSDALITLCYLCIPVLLLLVARKRRDIQFHWMFVAFGASILACGATHAMAIVTLWKPLYRLDGLIKSITAVASVLTAAGLFRLMPLLRKTQNPGPLAKANEELAREIARRVALEEKLEATIAEQRVEAQQLRDREQQVELAFEAAKVGAWRWSTVTGELHWDSHMRKLYGVPADAPVTHVDQFFSVVHPDDLERVGAAASVSLNTGSDFQEEFRVVYPDGSAHWIGARGAVVRDAAGQTVAMTGINLGIDGRKAAESALQESEKQFATLANTIPQLAWMANPDGYIFWYNRRWYEYTNTTPEQMEGWGWQSVHDPEELPRVLERWQGSIRTGAPFDMEFPLLGGDGVFRWFLTRVTPLRDADGKIARWFGTNTDVTEKREIREALREKEQQFRQIANAMPQIVWTSAPDGGVDYYNDRWYDYTGLTFDQTKDWGWKAVLHPDDLQAALDRWSRSLATGEDYQIECRMKRAADGQYRWHLARAVPVVNAENKVVRWFGTSTDIEDYKKAELEIKELNEGLEQRVRERTAELALAHQEAADTRAHLEVILEAATHVAIVATDAEGVIQVFNSGAERMLQYRAEEVVDRATTGLFHVSQDCAGQAREINSELARADDAHARQVAEREWTFVRKDGTTLEAATATTAVRDGSGTVTGFVGTASDITLRKKLERELRDNNFRLQDQTRQAQKANETKSAFLAAMSHEIRTPMNALLGMADLLWESRLDQEQRQYVEVFRRAGGVLLNLINDLLDLSKIEAGHLELEHIPFDLEDVCAQSLELVGPKANAKRLALLCRISPKVEPNLTGDGNRLQQVLVNLLGNAVKFTEAGEVMLRVDPGPSGDPGDVEIAVSDTGIGIPLDKLGTIFEDFTQADASTTRRYGGTGLGLGISRRLVGCMGGTLVAESRVGQGSTFRFTARFDRGPAVDGAATRSEVGDLYGRRVLVIDNNETNRQILRETLTFWGLSIVECAGAVEARDALLEAKRSDAPFAAVLLDRHMPVVDGFAAVPLLRAVAPDIPIIMLTSDDGPGDAARRRELNLSAFAPKPVRRADLLRLLCGAMRAAPVNKASETTPGDLRGEIACALQPIRILIAEDSPDNCKLLQAYLKNSPYTLTFADNGEAAVERFAMERFGLVLMDMQMPVMDGLSATRAIREIESNEKRPRVPVIALTANAMVEDIEASRSAGCDAHISKPISKGKLISAIVQYGLAAGNDPAFQPGVSTITLDVPDELRELFPQYLEARLAEAPAMLKMLEARQFRAIASLAHNLKWTGTSFGLEELTRRGAGIEVSAKEANAADLGAQLEQLQHYLSRVQSTYSGQQI